MDKWGGLKVALARTDIGEIYYLVDTSDFSFIPVVKSYLDLIAARAPRSISPNTSYTYCYHLRYYFAYLKQRGLDYNHVTYEDLVSFRLWLKNPYRFHVNVSALPGVNDLSEKTINAIIDRVSSLYRWLKDSSQIAENPVKYKLVKVSRERRERELLTHVRRSTDVEKNILKSREPKKRVKIIEETDFRKMLAAVKTLRDKLILLLLKEGGLRKGELLGLKLEDIDFGGSGVWVRFRGDNSNKARAKGGYGRDRFVDLPPDLMTLLDEYISTEWLQAEPCEDFLFVIQNDRAHPGHNGSPLTSGALMSIFNFYSKKTGIHIHPHLLRHTHATELVRSYLCAEEPMNWEFIKERLGHRDVTTTINMYIHLTREDYKKEYRKITRRRREK